MGGGLVARGGFERGGLVGREGLDCVEDGGLGFQKLGFGFL